MGILVLAPPPTSLATPCLLCWPDMAKKPNKKDQKQNEKGKAQGDKSEEQSENGKGPVKKDRKPNVGHKSRIPDKLAEAKAKGLVSWICLHAMITSHGLTILDIYLG